MARPLPLAGCRIVVTRAPEQAMELSAAIVAAGGTSLALPTIAIAPPADGKPLDAAIRTMGQYTGVVFTSINAVRRFVTRAKEMGVALQPPAWVCAIGLGTAAELTVRGMPATAVALDARSEGVLAALGNAPLQGERWLLPRATGREVIPAWLRRQGASVVEVETHSTKPACKSRTEALRLFPSAGMPRAVDAAVFTSPSTLRGLAAMLSDGWQARLAEVAVVVIGPVTRAAVEAAGLTVTEQADQPTPAALVAALQRMWRARTA